MSLPDADPAASLRVADAPHLPPASQPTDAPAQDPWEACLCFLLDHHERPLSPAALRARVARPDGAWTQADFIDAIERLGFETVACHGAEPPAPGPHEPVLLIGPDDEPHVLIGALGQPGSAPEWQRWEVFLPRSGRVIALTATELSARHGGHWLQVLPPRRLPASEAQAVRGRHGHWFWGPNRVARPLYLRAVLASIVTSVFALSTSVFTMIVYDRVIPNSATETLWALLAGIGIVLLSDFAIRAVRGYFLDVAGSRADVEIADAVFDQVLDLDLREQRGSSGGLASLLKEYETLRDFATSATLTTLIDLPFALLFIAVLWLIGGPMAWVPLIAIPLVVIVGLAMQPSMRRDSEVSQEDSQTKQAVLIETLAGLETIKAIGAGAVMRRRWQDAVTHQARISLRSRLMGQLAGHWANLVLMASQVAVVSVGVFLAVDGQIGSGAIVAASILCGRAVQPLAQLTQLLLRLNQSLASYRALARVMALPREHTPGVAAMPHDRLRGSIELRDVRFSYPGSEVPVLDTVSLRIEPGQRVAIIGRIGSGKSTLLKMLVGLYRPVSGQLSVGGIDVRQIDPADLRRHVAAVLQDCWLMSGTLRQNIALGADRPGDDEIRRAAEIAGAHDFIAAHPQGYQMRLGENGAGLSGGQRQAVAMARALVGHAPIVVLDEPTSAMDPAAESQLLARLKTELAGRTLVLVTHKPSMLELVDHVIVMDGGRIVAQGPKDVVMRQGGKVAPVRSATPASTSGSTSGTPATAASQAAA
ncbi:type I secretion system permease/ATPase [Leptothrix discophora]|uniref:Type I secretion system permease/ATPase n=1 Tax=Leptothrix discophora TaxID=89 RepID=A0ABT9G431_LEPDI|nr:type I secretion system permease/ATPase [Leptothrix discophora]MDP4301252.1 type I secretion system permease/ATPase [Leptothrix discophora]